MFGWTAKEKNRPGFLDESGGGETGHVLITGNVGLVDGTRVATPRGWRPVESLCAGEQVLTFDNGMQRITEIQSELHDNGLRPGQMPVRVPSGALGNRRDLWMMPDQGLVVECDAVEEYLGDPFVVVPALALDGFRGIAQTATESLFEATVLTFAQDEAIYVEGGMLAFCPRPRDLLVAPEEAGDTLYEVLDRAQAKRLVQSMIRSEAHLSFSCDPEEIACIKTRKTTRPARLASQGA